MALAKSRATRSSWPPARIGSKTRTRPPRISRQPRRTRLRARNNDPLDAHTPERTCVLTRRKGTREELIRLALGPDNVVAPDVRARAPGRRAWIGVTRSELDAAKGKLKGPLHRAFNTHPAKVPADLGELTNKAL